jgi:hypothetical protein
MTRRRLLPVAIAVVILAVISVALWWFNRSAAVPTAAPSNTPAVGSCWNLDVRTATGRAPWDGKPVPCNAPHTIEVFYTGAVDRKLARNQRNAKGQSKQLNTLLMAGEARYGCTAKAQQFLGDSPRGEQVAVLPDFMKPTDDGFYVCAMAQSTSPNNEAYVTRTSSLAGAARSLVIECVSSAADGSLAYVSCKRPHDSEYAGTYQVTPLNAPYNGTALQTAVPNGCKAIVDAFMGLAKGVERSDVSSAYVGPTSSDTWLGSDQSFACYAHTAAQITGTLEGLGARPLP